VLVLGDGVFDNDEFEGADADDDGAMDLVELTIEDAVFLGVFGIVDTDEESEGLSDIDAVAELVTFEIVLGVVVTDLEAGEGVIDIVAVFEGVVLFTSDDAALLREDEGDTLLLEGDVLLLAGG